MGIRLDKSNISISYIDFIKIKRLKTKQLPFDIDSPLSWSLHLGAKNQDNCELFASGGVGYTWQVTPKIKLYTFLEFSLHTREENYQFYPNIGIFADYNSLKFSYEYGKSYQDLNKFITDKHKINLQYNFNNEKAIFINLEEEEDTSLSLGLKWYF